MNNMTLAYESGEELDQKRLFRGNFNNRLREDVQPNVGRIQQVGTESYCSAYSSQQPDYIGFSRGRWCALSASPAWITGPSGNWDMHLVGASSGDADYRELFLGTIIFFRSRIHSEPAAHSDPASFWAIAGNTRRMENFVQRAERLSKAGNIDAALDIIYDNVDSLLSEGKLTTLDSLLKSAEVNALSTDLLLGLLTSTLPAKTKLLSRKDLFQAVEGELRKRKEWEDGILTGLEG